MIFAKIPLNTSELLIFANYKRIQKIYRMYVFLNFKNDWFHFESDIY